MREDMALLYEIDYVFRTITPVLQRTQDSLRELLLKHGVTYMPAIDAMPTFNSVDTPEVVEQHNQLIVDTTIRRIIGAIRGHSI
jgi:hypothetical protein